MVLASTATLAGCGGSNHPAASGQAAGGPNHGTTAPETQTNHCIDLLDAWVPYMSSNLTVGTQQLQYFTGSQSPILMQAVKLAAQMDGNTYSMGIAQARTIVAPAITTTCESLAAAHPEIDFTQYPMPPTG